MLRAALAICLFSFASAGCAARSNATSATVDEAFDCRSRKMGYVVEGGFGAHRAGVVASCEENQPMLTILRQETVDSEPQIRRESISSGVFEELWEKIDSTGWRNLEDCQYIGLDKDPKYDITIADHLVEKSISCAAEATGSSTPELEFPNNSIVNELDRVAAARGR